MLDSMAISLEDAKEQCSYQVFDGWEASSEASPREVATPAADVPVLGSNTERQHEANGRMVTPTEPAMAPPAPSGGGHEDEVAQANGGKAAPMAKPEPATPPPAARERSTSSPADIPVPSDDDDEDFNSAKAGEEEEEEEEDDEDLPLQ